MKEIPPGLIEQRRIDIGIGVRADESIIHYRELLKKIDELIKMAKNQKRAKEIEGEIIEITKLLTYAKRIKDPPEECE